MKKKDSNGTFKWSHLYMFCLNSSYRRRCSVQPTRCYSPSSTETALMIWPSYLSGSSDPQCLNPRDLAPPFWLLSHQLYKWLLHWGQILWLEVLMWAPKLLPWWRTSSRADELDSYSVFGTHCYLFYISFAVNCGIYPFSVSVDSNCCYHMSLLAGCADHVLFLRDQVWNYSMCSLLDSSYGHELGSHNLVESCDDLGTWAQHQACSCMEPLKISVSVELFFSKCCAGWTYFPILLIELSAFTRALCCDVWHLVILFSQP